MLDLPFTHIHWESILDLIIACETFICAMIQLNKPLTLLPSVPVVCPVLCSGHGDYVGGECRCHPGYKGRECQLQRHECEVPDCGGRGQCKDGRCHCAKGFTGDFCQTGEFCVCVC